MELLDKADYRSHCNEVWLILVVGDVQLSSVHVVDDEVYENEYQSEFDKVILFEWELDSWHELRVQH